MSLVLGVALRTEAQTAGESSYILVPPVLACSCQNRVSYNRREVLKFIT